MSKRTAEEDENPVKKVCEEDYEDLLAHCRAWKVKTVEEFWQNWIGHPKARTRVDIFGELAMYQFWPFPFCLESQIRWVVRMWLHAQEAEEGRGKNFESLEEAVRYLEKENIIEKQYNI